ITSLVSQRHCSLSFAQPPPPTGISPLSLHDALPIYRGVPRREHGALREREVPRREVLLRDERRGQPVVEAPVRARREVDRGEEVDRKSTRLNSSHVKISYAVFCLKKKRKIRKKEHRR